ncbi:MAG: acyl-CoA dehydrogenase family protein [Actinomycetota bacterium]|nr:acyl-CoA dehydrogenase family protein [Actinomycetota bacterium]
MYKPAIPNELLDFADTIKTFVKKECEPIDDLIEEQGKIPEDMVQKIREFGLFGMTIPEQYGGLGIGAMGYCLVAKALSWGHGAFRSLIAVNNGIGSQALLVAGNEEQKKKYLPDIAGGKKITSFCLTEPGAGSDAAAMATTAVKDGKYWVINGLKHFITNAPIADIYTVLALTDKEKRAKGGITAFIVEKGTPGLKIGQLHNHMGSKAAIQSEVIFDNCRIPEENVIGKVGEGFRIAMKTLDIGRLTLAASCIGYAEKLLKMGSDYAKTRVQFEKPIAKFQAIQWMLADCATEIYAANSMLTDACLRYDGGERSPALASMTKLYASEMACRVADRVLQIHGGMGYMVETKVERYYRDLRLYRIVEGTSEIQRLVISRSVLKDEIEF